MNYSVMLGKSGFFDADELNEWNGVNSFKLT